VAARRLILVMLALLVLSSIAAALIPVERSRLPVESTSTKPTEPGIPAGTFVHRTVSAQASRPAKIALEVGDQLGLTVRTSRAGLVEIPAFGELQNADPGLPAHFDLLALERGRFPVRLVDRRTVAMLVVSGRAQADGDNSSAAPGSSTQASTSGASSPS
jgi:hypothetical protein